MQVIQRELARRGEAKTKQWWERYLRGMAAAERIVKWKSSKPLWQRHAAAVAFVNLAKRGQYADQILEACKALVQSSERFAQTGVGWVLRELKRAEPERVAAFVRTHRARMSKEALGRVSSAV